VKKYTGAFLFLVVILVVVSSVLYAFANDTNEYIPINQNVNTNSICLFDIRSEESPCPYIIAQTNDIVEQYADYLSRMGLQLYLPPISVIESPQRGRRYTIQSPMIKRLSEDSVIEVSKKDIETIMEVIGLLNLINFDGFDFDPYFIDALESSNLMDEFRQLLQPHLVPPNIDANQHCVEMDIGNTANTFYPIRNENTLFNIEVCSLCAIWHYPDVANFTEEYMTRYYFPEMGFSYALPTAWADLYIVGAHRPTPPYVGGEARAMIHDRNEIDGGTLWAFRRSPNQRENLRYSARQCGYQYDIHGRPGTFVRIFLAQDDEYTYYVLLHRSFLERFYDEQSITNISQGNIEEAESFAEMSMLFPFVLNSFRLITSIE